MGYLKYEMIWSGILWLCSAVPGYFLFRRSGQEGWKSFIPIYDRYIYYLIVWETLPFTIIVLCFIVIAAAVLWVPSYMGSAELSLLAVITIIILHGCFCFRMAKFFGKGILYAIGLFLLFPVFSILITFGLRKSEAPEGLVEQLPIKWNGWKWRLFRWVRVPVLAALMIGYVFSFALNFNMLGIRIDQKNFPDESFRSSILDDDYGKDYFLTKEEQETVTYMFCFMCDPVGLKYFPALTTLRCVDLDLPVSTVDTSGLPELEAFSCRESYITSLDLSKNLKLKELNCHENNLLSLDVTKNSELREIWCEKNSLRSLNVENNPKLERLWCDRNMLETLDVSMNPELSSLTCAWNNISSLDVSCNTKLEELDCRNCSITGLDLSENRDLKILKADGQRVVMDVKYDPADDTYKSENKVLDPSAEVTGAGVRFDPDNGQIILNSFDGQTAEFSVAVYDAAGLEEGDGCLSGTIEFWEVE